METGIIIAGLVIAVFGVIACLLPLLPGPLISFISLVLLSWASGWVLLSKTVLVIFGLTAVLVIMADGFLAVAGARRFGASTKGLMGAVAGTVVGFFFLPPAGMIIGAVLGTLAGELFDGKRGKELFRAGWGVLFGNLVSLVARLAYSVTVLAFYVWKMT